MDDLIANYVQLAGERDWTVQQMADHIEPMDKALAARLRSERVEDPEAAPEGRRSAAPKQDG